VIEINLMTGMNVVGDLFGLGKCFASGGQIGSSDEKAVAYLLPLLKQLSKLVTNQEWKNPYGNRKGDVHDIGKNKCR
jgi:5-methyltetrahydrofolate--homocysteine methyltransferase